MLCLRTDGDVALVAARTRQGHWRTWSTPIGAEVNAWLTAQLDKRRKTPSSGQQPQP